MQNQEMTTIHINNLLKLESSSQLNCLNQEESKQKLSISFELEQSENYFKIELNPQSNPSITFKNNKAMKLEMKTFSARKKMSKLKTDKGEFIQVSVTPKNLNPAMQTLLKHIKVGTQERLAITKWLNQQPLTYFNKEEINSLVIGYCHQFFNSLPQKTNNLVDSNMISYVLAPYCYNH